MISALLLVALASPDVIALKKCAANTDPSRRLECFDAWTAKKGYQPKAVQSSSEEWSVTENVSPVDDTSIVTASRDADKEITGWPSKRYKPTMILRCQSRALEVFVITGMAESGDATQVTMRFDKEPAATQQWGHSTDGNALFLPGGPRAKLDFIQKLIGHEHLLFQITPFNSGPTLTTFTVSGVATAAERVKRACGYGLREIPPIGIKYVSSTKELARKHGVPQLARGVIVTDVPPESIASGRIAPGDLVVGLNGKSVRHAEALDAALEDLVRMQHEGPIVIEFFRRMDTLTFEY